MFKNSRPLFSLLFSDLIIPKQSIEVQIFFLNRGWRFLKMGTSSSYYIQVPPPGIFHFVKAKGFSFLMSGQRTCLNRAKHVGRGLHGMCHFSGYHSSVKVLNWVKKSAMKSKPSTIFMMIFSSFGRLLEESSCTRVFLSFPFVDQSYNCQATKTNRIH